MRIVIVSIASLLVFFTGLLTVKFWGKGQSFTEYRQPLLQSPDLPLHFIKPGYAQVVESVRGRENVELDVTNTLDQKLVVPLRAEYPAEKPIHLSNYAEVKDRVLLVSDYKDVLKSKKVIFNIFENNQAAHEIFFFNMQQMGFDKGENYIVTSPYEAPIKALKELAPALVYGSTQPEILKMVAMQSMWVLEAASIRADVIIHPLKIHGQDFFNEGLRAELARRFKKIIVGPVKPEEVQAAIDLHPFAIITPTDASR